MIETKEVRWTELTTQLIPPLLARATTIELWLHLTLPSIEDGDGVGIVMEGAKMIADRKKELLVRVLVHLCPPDLL